jgi:TonB family protein
MCNFAAVVKRVIPFVVAFGVGVFVFSLFPQTAIEPKIAVSLPSHRAIPSGSASSGIDHGGSTLEKGAASAVARTENFRITSKPQARYTDEARTNDVEGTVRLKVVLLASGKLGNIWAISKLPHGLTEQAIAAARNIRFQPKRVNGVPQSVIVTIDYNFNLY